MSYILVNKLAQSQANMDARLTYISEAQNGKLMYQVGEGISFAQLSVMYGSHIEPLQEDSSRNSCPHGCRQINS